MQLRHVCGETKGSQKKRSNKRHLPPIQNMSESESDLSDSSLLAELANLVAEFQNCEPSSEESESDHNQPESEKQREARMAAEKARLAKLAKLESLAQAVSSCNQCRDDTAAAAAPACTIFGEQASSSASPVDRQSSLSGIQRVAEVLENHNVKEAIKSLKQQSKEASFPTAQLESCMKDAVRHDGGLLSPEEVVEEGLVALADSFGSAEPSAPVFAPQARSMPSELQVWASKLEQTAASFQVCQDNFFQVHSKDLSIQHDKCISLMNFVVKAEEGEAGPLSFVQFVSWDWAARRRGRRLRIERGRFVWRPPAKTIDGHNADDLSDMFDSGARIIIADCGATLVKQRGQFRTSVPPNIFSIYQTLFNAVQVQSAGDSLLEYDRCFVCGQLVGFMCPLCKLRSHRQCCESLATSAASSAQACAEGHAHFDEVQLAVALAYKANTNDSTGSKLQSVVSFDSADQTSTTGAALIDLLGTICFLCAATLAVVRDNGQAVFDP